MLINQHTYNLFRPDKAPNATREDFEETARGLHMLPIPYVQARDISNALVFLASDEARYITAISLPVDGGWTQH
jgi:NAD(P)-dependent dehydrogenase (short-subunit alcohol dehydrogenase family)